MSALTLAAREKLDNLVWVVNCNLQRLDGPVRGNGRIIDELEKLFAGAGWNVIKLVWGSDWDGLFARDTTGALARAFANTVDGQMQTFAAKDGRFNREHFFGQNEELARLAQGMTDEQIDRLKRGGHDLVKIHAAYAAAAAHRGQPTVILAHTKKGYGMGSGRPGQDDHALAEEARRAPTCIGIPQPLQPAADRTSRPTSLAFYKPADDSAEMRYLHAAPRSARRLPAARARPRCDAVPVPDLGSYAQFALAADGKEMSTTMAFVRMLGNLLKDTALGPAHRAHRGRRGAHLRHGQPVQAGRHLFERGPALRAGRHRLGAVATARRPTARSWKKASAKPAPSPAGRPRPPATACTAWRCCRSTSTTRCSASSAWATRSGPRPTSARAASCWARPRAAPRWAAKACSTRTAAATWWPRPSRTARPTTRPSPARWR